MIGESGELIFFPLLLPHRMTDSDDSTAPLATPNGSREGVFAGQRVALTGVLASMTHRQAADLIEELGGQFTQHVTQTTTLLVVGEEGWPLEEDGQPSVKLEQARLLMDQGLPIRLLSESEWLAAAGLEPRELRRGLYTPAMLSRSLGISVHEIRRWERTGLIQSRRRVHRLTYFDPAEVATVRHLAELIRSGVSLDRISSTLNDLQSRFPELSRPLDSLQVLLSRGTPALVLRSNEGGWIDPRTRQRLFSFTEDSPPVTDEEEPATLPFPSLDAAPGIGTLPVADWERMSEQALADDDLPTAEFAIRRLTHLEPHNPRWHFELADILYRRDKPQAAAERYAIATELDPEYLEAWVQAGCVYVELGEPTEAKAAFAAALALYPELADVHFHLGELAHRAGETDAARLHWRKYLELDNLGPWADVIRQRLGNAD